MATPAQLQPPTTPQVQPVAGTTGKEQTAIVAGGAYDPQTIQKEFDRIHGSINSILVEMAPLLLPVIPALAGGSTTAQCVTSINQIIVNLNALTLLMQQAGLLQS